MLVRKIIKNESLGLKQDKPEHTQYVVIMPVILACHTRLSDELWHCPIYWDGYG